MALNLHNRSWYPFILPVGSAVVIACRIYFPSALGSDLLLSGIGTVTGFTYFIYRQHLDETKLFKELFVEFNARYDKLNNGLNTICYGSQTGDLSDKEQKLLFKYFNLCSEEYLFYKTGYIDKKVWNSWCKGMDIFFKHPRINPLWKRECKDSYYGFLHD